MSWLQYLLGKHCHHIVYNWFKTPWGITEIPLLSMDTDFPIAISCHIWCNWPPASRRNISVQYVCVCVCEDLKVPTHHPSSSAILCSSPELLWRHSVSWEMLGTADIVQSVDFFFFTRLKLEILRTDVPYLIVEEEHRHNRFMLWKCSAGTEICNKGRNVI